MKNKLPRAERYLPTEILTDVLVKLPVKILLRFRSVCKRWCSIIDSPLFISKHSSLCNSHQTYLLTVSYDEKYKALLTTVHPQTFEIIDGKMSFSGTERYGFWNHSVQSVRGLVLLGNLSTPPRIDADDEYTLCNLSLKKSLKLPRYPLQGQPGCFVLGFDPSTADYKVASLMCHPPHSYSVAVYSLSTHLWTVRSNLKLDHQLCLSHRLSSKFFTRGAVHWSATSPDVLKMYDPNFCTHIISFDLATEQISCVELPSSKDDNGNYKCKLIRRVFLLGESLAVLDVLPKYRRVWVLRSEDRSWTQWFIGRSSLESYDFFFRSRIFKNQMFVEKSRKLLCRSNGVFKSYDIDTQQIQVLTNRQHFYGVDIIPYLECLVSNNRFESQDHVNTSIG